MTNPENQYIEPPVNSLIGTLSRIHQEVAENSENHTGYQIQALVVWQYIMRECNVAGRSIILDQKSIENIENIFTKFYDQVELEKGLTPDSVKTIINFVVQIGKLLASVTEKNN